MTLRTAREWRTSAVYLRAMASDGNDIHLHAALLIAAEEFEQEAARIDSLCIIPPKDGHVTLPCNNLLQPCSIQYRQIGGTAADVQPYQPKAKSNACHRQSRGMTEKRLLQIAILVFGLVPVLAGISGMVGRIAIVVDARDVSLDSHVRFLSGLLFGIGIGFWSVVPKIETMSARCRLLTAIVFIGGLARLTGLVFDGVPSTPMVLAIGMELAVTPLLCLWQARIAQR